MLKSFTSLFGLGVDGETVDQRKDRELKGAFCFLRRHIDFSYFNEQRAYRKRNEYIEGINDWKYLKFLDPTQVEGFKQARDKRQYLSEVTMCPKAIYTLDLTSDVDIAS